MAQDNLYKVLELELPQSLLDGIIDGLASLHAIKNVDERGRQLWVYDETVQIRRYTDLLLEMDSSIDDIIRDRGLQVCPIEKGPRVVRTGDGPEDFHVASPDRIAIVTPMTHTKTRIYLAGVGEPSTGGKFVDASKHDHLVIHPNTRFRVEVPYYMMIRTVRKV
ncbi:hypothetical protein H634G_10902 [Metarhizium anisopliae BRIP 53293]|uniref:Uncharacterized protein n=1 Tax=Metarhizium anisopliae BRIP 53293 TaxID=1291518 RepID=A0A0D9NIR8_METAN|nr:hypothetical protein H634G_10902 [Metarhizium anisopliae BRIP 53293]KJK86012.1 hypothetical protein H633G_10138 [Metarhizium anisopliae BRIP 53284]